MSTFFMSLLGSFMAPKVLAALGGVLALILADFILGVLVAMKTKSFDVRKLPGFMESSFLPYAGGLLILALFSSTDPTLEVLFFAIAAAVYAKFLADIKDKIAQLFAGISIQSQAPAQPQNATSQPVIANDSVVTPAPVATDNTEPKSIVDVVASTLIQVGEQAKTVAVNNLTQKYAAVSQEAVTPELIPVSIPIPPPIVTATATPVTPGTTFAPADSQTINP